MRILGRPAREVGGIVLLILLILACGLLALGAVGTARAGSADSGSQVTATAVPTATPIPAPRLTFSKIANASSVQPGDFVAFTLTVTNSGNADAIGLHVQDALPGGVIWFTGTDTMGCTLITGVLGCGPFNIDRRHLNDAEDDFENGSVSIVVFGIAPTNCGALANSAILIDSSGAPIGTARAAIIVRCPPTPTPVTPTATATNPPPTEAPFTPTIRPIETPTPPPASPTPERLIPRPPNTGSGSAQTDGNAELGWLPLTFGLAMVVGGLSMIVLARRHRR